MRILFIQVSECHEALGLQYLAAALRAAGHHCGLIISSLEKDYLKSIALFNPDIIGFSATCHRWRGILQIAREIKKRFDVPILIGGPHATFCPEIIEEQWVDIVCRGEGEAALVELVDHLERNESLRCIRNLWVKEGGAIYKNELRPLEDLDRLPFPDRTLYARYGHIRDVGLLRIIAGRGCEFRCTYCNHKEMAALYQATANYVRRRDPHRVVAEICEYQQEYPVSGVTFLDDNFTSDKQWLRNFRDAYKGKIKHPFFCSSRLESMDPETIALLKDAGCRGVRVGIESGSERIRQEILNRALPNDRIIEAVVRIKAGGLKVATYNMFGLPTETFDDALETFYLNRKIRPDAMRNSIFFAHPKLEITVKSMAQGVLDIGKRDRWNKQEMVVKHQDVDKIQALYGWMPLLMVFPFFMKFFNVLLKMKAPRQLQYFEVYGVMRFHGARFWGVLKYFLLQRKCIKNNVC